jgi:HEAT repeat protein/S1-C subfamily serine protease
MALSVPRSFAMPIRVVCPGCRGAYQVPDNLRGKKIRCKNCDKVIPVGGADDEPDVEVMAEDDYQKKKPTTARKPAPAVRRRGEDDEDDGPRRRRGGRDKDDEGSSVALIAGAVIALVIVAAGIAGVMLAMRSSGTKDTAAVAKEKDDRDKEVPRPVTPVVVTPPVVTPPVTPPVAKKPDDPLPVQPAVATQEQIYKRLLKCTALIYSADVVGENLYNVSSGSGTLIDKANRLVLTNYHVISSSDSRNEPALVFFPEFGANKEPITRKDHYLNLLKTKRSEALLGMVVYKDPKVDLALVQLNRLPAVVEALPFASRPVNIAQQVHSVGNPGASETGWVYTQGKVRSLDKKRKWLAGGIGLTLTIETDVIVTDSPINPGDSGGPLVNDRCEQVGITQGLDRSARGLSLFVDLSEARRLIDGYERLKKVKVALEQGSGIGVDTSALPRLLAALQHADAKHRQEAVQGLTNLGSDAQLAVPDLLRCMKDTDKLVRQLAKKALDRIGPPDKSEVKLLVESLRDDDADVRLYALDSLGHLGPDARPAAPELLKALRSGDTEFRQRAARALARLGPQAKAETVPALFGTVKGDAEKDVRVAAAEALAESGLLAVAEVPALQEALKSPDAEIRTASARCLGRLGPDAKAAAGALLAMIPDKDVTVRQTALMALAQIGPDVKAALPELQKAVKDPDVQVRRHALEVVGTFGTEAKAAFGMLREGLKDSQLRNTAVAVVTKLGPAARELTGELMKYLGDRDGRPQVLEALAAVKMSQAEAKAAVPRVIQMFDDPDLEAVVETADGLAKCGKIAVPYLRLALRDRSNPRIRFGAVRALGTMGPEAKEALPDLEALKQVEQDKIVRLLIDHAIPRIR